MTTKEHAANIGWIVLALAQHEVGDWGDCSINHPVSTIVDRQEPAHKLLLELADMDEETASGIAIQLGYAIDDDPAHGPIDIVDPDIPF